MNSQHIDVPIFDCVTHPTLDGSWMNNPTYRSNDVASLLSEMKASRVSWAFCIGMPGVGQYEAERYASHILESGNGLFPVAVLDLREEWSAGAIGRTIGRLKTCGYVGVKVHPRLSAVTYDDPRVAEVIKETAAAGLVAMLCTYSFEPSPRCSRNTIAALSDLLVDCEGAPLILLHGGGVRLLEVAELVRCHASTLLDLSFTLLKYQGSSLDLDMRFLCDHFDRRVCVGSDSPEFGLAAMRERFDALTNGVAREKIENIAFRNLFDFTGLEL